MTVPTCTITISLVSVEGSWRLDSGVLDLYGRLFDKVAVILYYTAG
jgi:hypothetical protein